MHDCRISGTRLIISATVGIECTQTRLLDNKRSIKSFGAFG